MSDAAWDLRQPPLRHGERLRLCFVSMEYPPAPCGGIGTWTHTLARGLARAGHAISVVTPAASGQPRSRSQEEGVGVSRIAGSRYYARSHPGIPPLHPLLRDHVLGVRDEVIRMALEEGLDAVSAPLWNVEGAGLLGQPPVCTILTLHTPLKALLKYPPDWIGSDWFPQQFAELQAAAECWALRKARFIIANSRAILGDLADLYGVSLDHAIVRIVPHGIEDVPGATEPSGPAPDGTVNVLFLGRHEVRKGIDTILAVVPMLLTRFPQVRFTIAGEQRRMPGRSTTFSEDFLQRHAGCDWLHRVSFPGFVTETQKQALYASADIFVAPSRFESFGLVYLEAMRSGKPVIGCQTGGAPEVIDDGITGILIPPGDEDALARALAELIGNPVLRSRMGHAARSAFKDRFTADHMIDRFCETVWEACTLHAPAGYSLQGAPSGGNAVHD